MKKQFYSLAFIFLMLIANCASAQVRILFDATKAEMAASADWVIDADVYNIGTGTGGAMLTGKGNEANPQKIPTAAQSGITSTTSETYWKGALSAWAVAMVKLGYTVETLPYNGVISYGNTGNPQDLINYKVFIVDEPNIKFNAAEKTAIVNFVKNGGGLFMISDHTGSDRNNDGSDSPVIWNDLMTNNTVQANPFGMSFDLQNFSQTTSNFNVLPSDPVLHGPAGSPTKMKFSNGTTITLNTSQNSSVLGLVYKTGSAHGATNAMMAHCHYVNGKVVALGDSSPPDDGTGDSNDALYNGWTGDVSGDHARILTNATIWLATTTVSPYRQATLPWSDNFFDAGIYPNPSDGSFNVRLNLHQFENEIQFIIYDCTGKEVAENKMQNINAGSFNVDNESMHLKLNAGIYLIKISTNDYSTSKRIIIH